MGFTSLLLGCVWHILQTGSKLRTDFWHRQPDAHIFAHRADNEIFQLVTETITLISVIFKRLGLVLVCQVRLSFVLSRE